MLRSFKRWVVAEISRQNWTGKWFCSFLKFLHLAVLYDCISSTLCPFPRIILTTCSSISEFPLILSPYISTISFFPFSPDSFCISFPPVFNKVCLRQQLKCLPSIKLFFPRQAAVFGSGCWSSNVTPNSPVGVACSSSGESSNVYSPQEWPTRTTDSNCRIRPSFPFSSNCCKTFVGKCCNCRNRM